MTDTNPAIVEARSAVTGQFTTEADAEAHPDTTVEEVVHKPGSGGQWVSIFVAWARGETDTLDFEGHEIPARLADLVSHL